MGYILIWVAAAVTTFLLLRRFALRDFGAVTVGGLIGLLLLSFITPCGLAIVATMTKPIDYSGMEPRKNPRQPIFSNHDCGGCDSGRLPCREGNYNNCSNPRARND
jgi:hypothetical protein